VSGPTKGMVAGQAIQTGAQTKEFDENHERIFGSGKKPTRGRWVWHPKRGEMVPADEYVPEHEVASVPVLTDRHHENTSTVDGQDIGSRAKRREYMKRTGLAEADDFKGHWADAPKRKAAEDARSVREIQDQVGRKAHELGPKAVKQLRELAERAERMRRK
jgi:hypothetical protein